MPAKYRVGVIASGRIAREHGRGWAECEHTEITAIADAHPEALASYAADFNVEKQYLDYREMLDVENLDIVSVCSWDPQHAEMSIAACARRPKAVLCEKPMAVSLGEAEAMVIAAERNDVKLAIGHQRRFYSSWREARQMIAAGAIGKPQRLWSAVKAGMMNTGTHCIDFQLYALGDPQAEWVMGSVERHTDHFVFGHRVEDRCAGIIGYPDGVEGVIENEMNDIYQVGATIYGERWHDGRQRQQPALHDGHLRRLAGLRTHRQVQRLRQRLPSIRPTGFAVGSRAILRTTTARPSTARPPLRS